MVIINIDLRQIYNIVIFELTSYLQGGVTTSRYFCIYHKTPSSCMAAAPSSLAVWRWFKDHYIVNLTWINIEYYHFCARTHIKRRDLKRRDSSLRPLNRQEKVEIYSPTRQLAWNWNEKYVILPFIRHKLSKYFWKCSFWWLKIQFFRKLHPRFARECVFFLHRIKFWNFLALKIEI